MDVDELSREVYKAIMIESEKFNHDLTLQFGLLSYNCNDEQDFIEKTAMLVKELKLASNDVLKEIFFGEAPNRTNLNKTLDKILDNLKKVNEIPNEQRHYDF